MADLYRKVIGQTMSQGDCGPELRSSYVYEPVSYTEDDVRRLAKLFDAMTCPNFGRRPPDEETALAPFRHLIEGGARG